MFTLDRKYEFGLAIFGIQKFATMKTLTQQLSWYQIVDKVSKVHNFLIETVWFLNKLVVGLTASHVPTKLIVYVHQKDRPKNLSPDPS